jgi:hypothetical protein
MLRFGISGLLALGLAACNNSDETSDAGIIAQPDTALPAQPDGGVTPAIDTSVPIDTSAAIDSGAMADPYVWVVVQDTEQKACSTNGPGADIDAVALWSATGAIGWGKLSTANYTANPLGNACENAECSGGACKYAAIGGVFPVPTLVAYTEGPKDAMVSATANDSGYFSLNGGTLQLQIGDLTGAGPAVELKKGDMIKVFEVDQTYITSGNAPASCSCLPEHYTVSLQTAKGATLALVPMTVEADNVTCTAPTAASPDGCGTTAFMVP